nr:NAD-dependent epimerase/dehydratase family protein [Candidatus Sigynarchaeota archaeon]
MTTIAITGIRSHVAHALLPRLMSDPKITRIIGIGPHKPDDLPASKVEFREIDIRDKLKLDEAFAGVDIVMHYAFVVDPKGFPEKEVLDTCIKGSMNVFEAAASQGVKKIIYTSSIAAYGSPPAKPGVQMDETCELRGKTTSWFYSRAKAAVEEFLHGFIVAHPGIITTVIRPSFICGCKDFYYVVKAFVDPVLQKKPFLFVKPVSYPQAMMQLTHEDDLITFILKAMNEDLPGPFNIASDVINLENFLAERGVSIRYIPWGLITLVLAIGGLFSQGMRYQHQYYTLFRNPPSMNCEKIKATGFTFKYPSTRDILAEAIELKTREKGI